MVKDLHSALGLRAREHVAVVGGGGKTSFMFALAEDLLTGGRRVVTSTTTKIWHREAMRFNCVIFSRSDPAWRRKVRKGLERHGHVFVSHGVLETGKIEGIDPVFADLLYRDQVIDYLILEADGSAGRPVKAPAAHEPVIPSSATVVVAMMGLEAIGKSLESEVVFRLDLFENLTGLERGEKLTPNVLARAFQAPEGLFKGTPISARRVAFLNKVDLVPGDQEARELAALLLHGSDVSVDMVVIGSILKGSYLVMRER